ncbi:uncharacterized protein MELLADRAFT_118709 [Melampsora larici-populina 98AG31]|uniref:Secreted protein n=1 Tax=Melampsora larici-populina (strain 98AG31 / pathotype 3-4-7) TaxID=747676 RepID=F4SE20_MELLP|nr:uncharacterized protein MELLADRAFT_118709 [Melampsora larici-populina 98AG31]EGF97106.1 secreted protein [Melampsora larici-populina 98AG31]
MKFYILLTIILQISPRLGDINSVSVFHMSDSALDERSSFSPLQKRKTSRNVVECRPTDRAPFGGILQDCLVCAGQLSKHHLSCTMLKTCAVVIVEPTTGKPSKVEKMTVEELVYRLPQSLDSTCTVTPLLRFISPHTHTRTLLHPIHSSIMSSEARLRIVKLDDNNYPEWKGDITGALMSASLDEFIDSDAEVVPAPEGPVSQERKVLYDVYVMRQRKAAGIMFSHMTQQFRIIVESEGFIYQPLKIWLLMKEKFQATTSSSKGRAYSAFTRIIFTSLDQYIKDTRSALATMRACSVNFSDDLQELIGETIVENFQIPWRQPYLFLILNDL